MKNAILLILVAFALIINKIEAQDFAIDASHSTVLMKVQRFGVVNVVGRFGDIKGTITQDSSTQLLNALTISVTVDSYTANNAGGEASAKGEAFLDGANHPELHFVMVKYEKREGVGYITGDLTIRGVKRSIEFPAQIIGPKMDLPTRKQSVALSGKITINRLDFGVGPDRNLPDGTEIISNKVEIELEILGIAL